MRLESYDADWLDEVVVWWMNELGPQSPLLLPDPELVELTSAELLAVVTYHASMEEWNFELARARQSQLGLNRRVKLPATSELAIKQHDIPSLRTIAFYVWSLARARRR